MTWTNPEAERVKTIEVKQDDMATALAEMSEKIDELLTLKNKGAGVLWVASILITGAFTLFVSWLTNLFNG